jgi:hypothetical protein
MTTANPYQSLQQKQMDYVLSEDQDIAYGIFLNRTALDSLRHSRYSNTSKAAEEIIDNAIQAKAQNIWVAFDLNRRRSVTSISFIDNGSGMVVDNKAGRMVDFIRYSLMLGGTTNSRPGDDESLGKFGLGLPMSSINQTKRVEVYSRMAADAPIFSNHLDIDELKESPSFGESYEKDLPAYVKRYLDTNNISFDHGSVITWDKPDRLTFKTIGPLMESMLEEFGVCYRYLIRSPSNPVRIQVADKVVEAIDPLFTTEGLVGYEPPLPEEHIEESRGGGARVIREETIAIERSVDQITGYSFKYVQNPLSENYKATPGSSIEHINFKLVRLPLGFAIGNEGIQGRRLRIRTRKRGISFVRSGREIDTHANWPRGERAKANGMGSFPLAQSYSYHWGVEIRFTPRLDNLFGISSDKTGVVPRNDLWQILHQIDLDVSLNRENQFQRWARRRTPLKPQPAEDGSPSPSEEALRDGLMSIMPAGLAIPEHYRSIANDGFEKLIEFTTRSMEGNEDGSNESEIKEHVLDEIRSRPYRIVCEELSENVFFKPVWEGERIKILVNTNHIFYSKFYSPVEKSNNAEMKAGLDILLSGLAQSELTTFDEGRSIFIQGQRSEVWSKLIDFSLRHMRGQIERSIGPRDEDDN